MSPKTRFDITACSASSGIADMAGRDINEQKPRTSAVSLLWLANDAVSRGARYGLLCYFERCRKSRSSVRPTLRRTANAAKGAGLSRHGRKVAVFLKFPLFRSTTLAWPPRGE